MVSGEICELPGCRNPRKVKPVHQAFVLGPLRMGWCLDLSTALVTPSLEAGLVPFFDLQM